MTEQTNKPEKDPITVEFEVLKAGDGMIPADFDRCPHLLDLLGTTDPTVAEARVRGVVSKLGDNKYAEALSTALGIDYFGDKKSLMGRREWLMNYKKYKTTDTIKTWELKAQEQFVTLAKTVAWTRSDMPPGSDDSTIGLAFVSLNLDQLEADNYSSGYRGRGVMSYVFAGGGGTSTQIEFETNCDVKRVDLVRLGNDVTNEGIRVARWEADLWPVQPYPIRWLLYDPENVRAQCWYRLTWMR